MKPVGKKTMRASRSGEKKGINNPLQINIIPKTKTFSAILKILIQKQVKAGIIPQK